MATTVLLVDDESFAQADAKTVLEKQGYRVWTVGSGEECLQVLHDGRRPDLLLIDIDLGRGRMDGAEAARLVYQSYDVPIVFQTGHSEPEVIAKVAQIPGCGCVPKGPRNEAFLLSTIGMALKSCPPVGATARKPKAHRPLPQSYYALFADISPDLVTVFRDQRIIYVSPAVESILGYTQPEFLCIDHAEVIHPDDREAIACSIRYRSNHGVTEPATYVYRQKHKDGRYRWLETVVVKYVDTPNLISVLHTRDVTHRVVRERLIDDVRMRLDDAMSIGKSAWWEWDTQSSEVRASSSKATLIGRNPRNFRTLEDWLSIVHPDDYGDCMQAMRDYLEGRAESYETEYRLLNADGEYQWFRDYGKIVESYKDGSPRLLRGLVQEITSRKNAQLELEKVVEENRVLMTEINHRVKNNLITVIALARIELANQESSKSSAITNVIATLKAVADVHDMLYSTGDFSSVLLSHYVSELMRTLLASAESDTRRYVPDIRVENIRVSSKAATQFGLIIAELVANTVKHADSEHTCTISLSIVLRDERIHLSYSDTGGGFPEEIQSLQDISAGTGMMIIRTFVGDLAGTIEFTRTGDSYELHIDCPAAKCY
jgi:PAS domain S-box-containing protein